MSATLKRASASLSTARTPLLTAAAGLQTIVINGLVSNTDSVNKAIYFVTAEVQTGTTYRVVLKEVPVAYGGSLQLPKIILSENDVLHLTSSANSVMEAYISYVEKG